MATQSQIESADTGLRDRERRSNNLSGGSTFVDPSIVPASLEACKIDTAKIPDMRRKINMYAKDEDDRTMLLSMILNE